MSRRRRRREGTSVHAPTPKICGRQGRAHGPQTDARRETPSARAASGATAISCRGRPRRRLRPEGARLEGEVGDVVDHPFGPCSAREIPCLVDLNWFRTGPIDCIRAKLVMRSIRRGRPRSSHARLFL